MSLKIKIKQAFALCSPENITIRGNKVQLVNFLDEEVHVYLKDGPILGFPKNAEIELDEKGYASINVSGQIWTFKFAISLPLNEATFKLREK